jgi:hypothetical protein
MRWVSAARWSWLVLMEYPLARERAGMKMTRWCVVHLAPVLLAASLRRFITAHAKVCPHFDDP